MLAIDVVLFFAGNRWKCNDWGNSSKDRRRFRSADEPLGAESTEALLDRDRGKESSLLISSALVGP